MIKETHIKSWEEMSNREKMEQTIRDLRLREERRKALKRKAEYEAKCFTIESSIRKRDKIRKSKTRGPRSF